MKNTTKTNLINKKLFVERVSFAIAGQGRLSVQKVEYEVWDYKNSQEDFSYTEVLKITFNGGAYLIRNVTGDSEGMIFQEIGNYIFGGYYDEVRWYQEMTASDEFMQVL